VGGRVWEKGVDLWNAETCITTLPVGMPQGVAFLKPS